MPPRKEPVELSKLVTDEVMEESLHRLAESIIPIGEAKGRLVQAEAMLRHIKATAMIFSGENAVSAQEREAFASNAYKDAIKEYREATVEYETLKAEREHAAMVVSVWQSQNKAMRT